MKKYLHLAGLILCGVLVLAVTSGRVFARLAGTDPGTDVWCVGISGAEVCVDSSGNFLPSTDNDTTLGTSSLRWATAYIQDITVGDDLTVTDDATITSDLAVDGNTTIGSNHADTLDLNVTTVTINATVNGVRIGTGALDGTYILTVDGSNRRIGVNDHTPSYDLDVNGDGQVSDDLIVGGDLFHTAVATQTITASATIDLTGACNGLVRIRADGDVTTNTTNTFTAPSAANVGCVYYVVSVADNGGTITLDDNAHFNTVANVAVGTNDGFVIVQSGNSYHLIGSSDN